MFLKNEKFELEMGILSHSKPSSDANLGDEEIQIIGSKIFAFIAKTTAYA